jgi:thiol-disulfide isomerase/thioredoxin
MRILKITVSVFFSFITLLSIAQKAGAKKNGSKKEDANENKGGYEISVTIKGFSNRMFYLGYYFGDKQYLRDSSTTDINGKMVFKGKKELEGGVYLIATSDKSLLFDFVVTEQKFSLESDSTAVIENMKVKDSPENEVFFGYTKFASKMGKRANEMEPKIKEAREKKDKETEDKLIADYRILMTELNEERKRIVTSYPNMLITKIFNMMKDPDVPEAPKDAKGNIIDSNFQYQYYKAHYFDNYDFKDDRITRTPIFFPKFESYMLKVVPQIPDSIIKGADHVLKLAEAGKENFKFCLFWTTNHYESSQFMGMDAVFVHLIDNYYAKGKAYWTDSLLIWKMKDKCDKLRYNLMGVKAKNLSMQDTSGKYHSLHNMDADYTLLFFWNATCGHCKEEMPKIVTAYKELNKGIAPKAKLKFDVFAVSLTEDPNEWKRYLIEQKLPWKLNVYDPLYETNFRNLYDVFTTPVLYILDKNKKIVAKRLPADQIKEYIENLEKEKFAN